MLRPCADISPLRPFHHQAGVTLLEMLVTLAIVAMVSALGFQMMAYLTRIETRMLAGDAGSNSLAVQREWLRHTISGVQAEGPGKSGRFQGGARRLSATSAIRPSLPEGGGVFVIELKFNSQTGRSEVLYSDERTSPVSLMSWVGDGGKFVFLDVAGKEFDTWPPAFGTPVALPRAVVLYPLAPLLPMVVAIGTSPFVFPMRSELERGLL